MAHSVWLKYLKKEFVVGSNEKLMYYIFTTNIYIFPNNLTFTFTLLIKCNIPIALSAIVSGTKNKTYLLPMIRLFLKKFMLENA